MVRWMIDVEPACPDWLIVDVEHCYDIFFASSWLNVALILGIYSPVYIFDS